MRDEFSDEARNSRDCANSAVLTSSRRVIAAKFDKATSLLIIGDATAPSSGLVSWGSFAQVFIAKSKPRPELDGAKGYQ